MKQVLLFLSAMLLLSCNAKQSTPVPATKPETNAPAPPSASIRGAGIVFGEGVRIRQDASIQSAVVSKISTGERVEILEVSVAKDSTTTNDPCEKYPMVKVKTASGTTGWIFGKFVFRILNNDEKTSRLNPVPFDGRMLQVKRCRNYGIGAQDKQGLTGCDEFYPVLLVDTRSGETFVVSLSKQENSISDFKYWCLEDDEGASEVIQSLQLNAQKQLTASVFAKHMEGCSRYQVNIIKSGRSYIGTCSNQKQLTESDCANAPR